jgi:hypothetical protein
MTPVKLLFLFELFPCTLYLLYLVKRDIKDASRDFGSSGLWVALKTGFRFKYDKIALNCFW